MEIRRLCGITFAILCGEANTASVIFTINGCSEQEAEILIPAIRYLLSLMRQQDNHK